MSVTAKSANIVLNYGAGITLRKYTIDWHDLVSIGAATSGDVALFTLPAFGIILKIIVKHTEQFVVGAGTFKVSVGKASGATLLTAATADLVATAVAAGTFQETNNPTPATTAELAIVANLVSSSGNLSTATAGAVDIYVWAALPSTP